MDKDMDKDKKNRQTEKEILSSIVDQTENVKKREWLPADFGEREKAIAYVTQIQPAGCC